MNTGCSYSNYRKLKKEYNEVKEKADRNKADLEYYQFQLNQLEEAKLKQGEQEELEAEQELLEHAEEIKTCIKRIIKSVFMQKEYQFFLC